MVVMTSGPTPAQKSYSFKEKANVKMSDIQKETMDALIEDDNKIEKLRGAVINITMKDDPKELKNGPIDLNDFKTVSFLEVEAPGGKYTKPISVHMKMPSDPDPAIQKEINNIEQDRDKKEGNLFKKAKEEFKLITALTVKELKINLNHELLPFFFLSKGQGQILSEIVSKAIPDPKKGKGSKVGFLQVDKEELKEKFPNLNTQDPEALNKEVYYRILEMFKENPTYNQNIDQTAPEIQPQYQPQPEYQYQPQSQFQYQSQPQPQFQQPQPRYQYQPQQMQQLQPHSEQQPQPQQTNGALVNFDYNKCLELAQNLQNINCDEYQQNYNDVNNYITSSFMETRADDDLINVKFASSDEPYPTIEKLVAQMETRRDLAEKYERLKILEFESHLQKAENEMIQDILHDNLYKIMSYYGPAIEGMRQQIR